MSRLTDRLERDLREVAAAAHPSPSAWDSIAARLGSHDGSELELALAPAPGRSKRPIWVAVAAALVVIAGSIAVLAGPRDDRSISAVDLPNLTSTFVSPRNGFSVGYFDRGDGTVTPATELWGFSKRVDDGFDVVETGLGAVFKGASTELSGVGSTDDRIDELLSAENVLPGGCGVPRGQQAEVTIDGRAGRVSVCANRIEATVVAGGRLYLFILVHDRTDAAAVFDAFVATIELRPETAIDFPGMTATFVSPTNGFSFRYHDRGGLAPATDLWDPRNQGLDEFGDRVDDGFDAVETGLGAYFLAASTEIPEGASIDAWVDEHVSPGGCSTPRSQQAEITIDGHPGRVAACANRIEATVVADGRLYLFTLLHSRRDATAFFDAWIATVELRPEAAAAP